MALSSITTRLPPSRSLCLSPRPLKTAKRAEGARQVHGRERSCGIDSRGFSLVWPSRLSRVAASAAGLREAGGLEGRLRRLLLRASQPRLPPLHRRSLCLSLRPLPDLATSAAKRAEGARQVAQAGAQAASAAASTVAAPASAWCGRAASVASSITSEMAEDLGASAAGLREAAQAGGQAASAAASSIAAPVAAAASTVSVSVTEAAADPCDVCR